MGREVPLGEEIEIELNEQREATMAGEKEFREARKNKVA